jgi:hypothetical protein
MGNFCSSCGTATDGGKFCPKCGSPQQPPIVNAAPKRGSPVLKIVLISIAVLFLLGIAGAVRVFYYVKDRVHEEVAQIKRDSGSANPQPTHAGCELLNKEKVAEILDATVARAEGNEAGDSKEYCKYWPDMNTAEDAKRTRENSELEAKAKSGRVDLKDIEGLIKGVSESATANRPLVSVNVFRGNGKAAMFGIKTAASFTGQKDHKLEGPWDEAYFGPFDAVMAVRRGDNVAVLVLGNVAPKREKGLELAKALTAAL